MKDSKQKVEAAEAGTVAHPSPAEAELAQRTAELELISGIQQALASRQEMQSIYDLVGDRIRDLFDAQVVVIATFDYEAGTEDFHYLFEDGQRFYPEKRSYNRIREKIIKTRQLILVNRDAQETLARIGGQPVSAVPGTRDAQSLLFVPLLVGETVRGYVSLQNLDREDAFSPPVVRMLSTLANSLSVALENARLFDEANRLLAETKQRNAELAVINSVQEGLVAELDLQGIYNLVGDQIRDLFEAQVIGIATIDLETHTETFRYVFEDGARHYPAPRPLDKIRLRLIKTRRMILINENAAEAYTTITGEAPKAVPGTAFPRSMIFVPLVIGETVRGYVSLQNLDREHAFSESDVRLLSTLANSMTVALENARLFNETQQRNAELAVINSVQDGLVAEMDMQGIYELVGERLLQLFDSQVTAIVTFDHEKGTEQFDYLFEDGDRLYPSSRQYDKVRQKIIDERAPLLFNENAAEKLAAINGQPHKPVPGTRAARSALYVPMVSGENVRGYLTLQNLDRDHVFTDSDVRLLTTLSNSMSVALENARLFSETTRLLAETEQRNAELAVINSVQEGLVAEVDMQGIYDLVGDRIREIFDAQVVMIATFDHAAEVENLAYLFEKGTKSLPSARPFDPLRRRLIKQHEPILINNNLIDELVEMGFERPEPVPGTVMPKSVMFVPMIVGETVRGHVSLQNVDREYAFTGSDVRLLSTLANSMSVALENARLFDETTRLLAETEQRNAELAVINSVQEGLVAEVDIQGIYDLVGERIRELFDAQGVVIATLDIESRTEHFQYIHENGERIHSEARSYDQIRQRLIETRELLLINDNLFDKLVEMGFERPEPVPGTVLPKSVIFVPLIVGDVVRGYISLQNLDRENAFTIAEVRLLSTLANSMSVALENARLFDETTRLLSETEQRAAELDTVNTISRALVAQLDLDALVHLVGEQMRETFRADIAYVALLVRETGVIEFPYAYGDTMNPLPLGEGITSRILKSGEPLLINADVQGRVQEMGIQRIGKKSSSYLGVPIMVGDAAVGVISVQSTHQEDIFDENDLRLLSTISANVGIALENAHSYQKLTAALEELKRTQAQLVQQEKLASLGALTAGIAHEIKNPLNFINNFAELDVELVRELRDEAINNPDARLKEVDDVLADIEQNSKKIAEHGHRADGIVRSMLDHSRGSSDVRQPTDLNALLDEYANLAYHGMRAQKTNFDCSIEKHFDPMLPPVVVMPQEIGRVFLNLLSNAFQAVYARAQSAERGTYKAALALSTAMTGAGIEVRVRDNGTGIPEDVKQRIFEPFFTTKAAGEGTGLGLSLSHDIIVQGHGGSIGVESVAGEGTEFIIALPVVSAEAVVVA
jgi:GAF domain-containing protein